MAMTKKIDVGGKIVSQAKARGGKYSKSPSPVHSKSPSRLTAVKGSEPPKSPGAGGILIGHYAGCKFTEPPSASALPLPPEQWMRRANCSVMSNFKAATNVSLAVNHNDFTRRLKMLLKVQA